MERKTRKKIKWKKRVEISQDEREQIRKKKERKYKKS